MKKIYNIQWKRSATPLSAQPCKWPQENAASAKAAGRLELCSCLALGSIYSVRMPPERYCIVLKTICSFHESVSEPMLVSGRLFAYIRGPLSDVVPLINPSSVNVGRRLSLGSLLFVLHAKNRHVASKLYVYMHNVFSTTREKGSKNERMGWQNVSSCANERSQRRRRMYSYACRHWNDVALIPAIYVLKSYVSANDTYYRFLYLSWEAIIRKSIKASEHWLTACGGAPNTTRRSKNRKRVLQ